MARTYDLACLGRAAVDLYGEQIGTPLEDVSTFARYLGGSPANTAVGVSRLGLSVAMITRVGDEQNGRFVRNVLAREGVDVSQVATDPKRLTALVFLAIRDQNDFPHIFYRENCADMALSVTDIDDEFIGRCGALLISGTHLSREGPRAAAEYAVRASDAVGTRVILDIDFRPVLWGLTSHADGAQRSAVSAAATASIAGLLPHCALVVGTEEEFCMAGGSSDVIASLRAVRARTSALLVLKLGAKGCVAFEKEIPATIESAQVSAGFPVEVFNTLGAGDAFMAGLLRGWLRGEPISRCCEYANACGAIVVSRHGCAPAMPTAVELDHFLTHGITTPRLREDRVLSHVHQATTRCKLVEPLQVLAFDHRGHFESLAQSHGGGAERISRFKALVADAFVKAADGRPGAGLILDDRYGEATLPRLTAKGYWIARPVESANSLPLEFESGDNLGLAMRTWPAEHVAKCLVYFLPSDSPTLQAKQLQRLATLAQACATTGHEMLVEVMPPPGTQGDATTAAGAMQLIYGAGIQPDWWKLPPSTQADSWRRVDDAIAGNDPLCRGVLVLGMEADEEALRAGFAAAVRSRHVRGFAVGRSIFARAAEEWFAGRWNDERARDDVAARYLQVVRLWDEASNSRQTHKEMA